MANNVSGAIPAETGIGALRWLVTLYRRDQRPGPNSAVTEALIAIRNVHADVQPTYPGTFYLSAQVETPITHLIRLRWLDYVELTVVVMRSTYRPTDRTYRTELYRVRRVKEIMGRKRFIELECELERAKTTAGDDDAERELLFAENPVIVEPTAA